MTTEATQQSTGHRPGGRSALRVAVIAVAVNLVVWLVGWAADADFRVTMGGQTITVTPIHVLATTLIALALGLLAAILVRRWGPVALRTLAVVGAAVGVVSAGAPLQADTDTSTAVALAAMHVLTGLIWLIALWRAAAGVQTGSGPGR